jgi:SpoVK/Ycf46/Vps4 family AAA+-type ATPase
MEIDLTHNIRKTLRETLDKARKAEAASDAEKAARYFDAASKLQLQLAAYKPLRSQELAAKKEALKYAGYAHHLREGGKVQANANDGAHRKKSGAVSTEKMSEIKNAVMALITSSPITWDQIGGLNATKRELKYTLGLAVAKPPEGVAVSTWRNILFYGPPGTGKTLLAAATSNALRTSDEKSAVFFNVKVSSVLSKYFGESTKIISELYGTARDLSPAVIFLDEFESLAVSRDGAGDTGAERRILSTILAEMDGLAEKGRTGIYVLTIAATNRPWDIDAAVLSRFEKKILIPMPDAESREKILEILLTRKGFELEGVTAGELAAMTEDFSGREIERFAKETTGAMVAEMNTEVLALVEKGLDALRGYDIRVRPLTRADFDSARRRITPSVTEKNVKHYLDWKEENA